jgi:hypothetical protein
LGIWLDPKLKWHAYAKVVQQKGLAALGALKRVTASTWGASFARARLLYNSSIRPLITYGAPAWFTPETHRPNPVIQVINKIQASGLRIVAGAYRATPVKELESETFTPPIDIYCNELRMRHLHRTYPSTAGQFITEQCQAIKARLLRHKQRRTTQATNSICQDRLNWANQRKQEFGTQGRNTVLAEWQTRWHKDLTKHKGWWCSFAAQAQPNKSILRLHNQLKKAESSALIQARTGRIGLRQFLFKVNVPGIDSPLCLCGKGVETAEHLLLFCDNTKHHTWPRSTPLRKLIADPASTSLVARHLIQSGRLNQFKLADRLLYG